MNRALVTLCLLLLPVPSFAGPIGDWTTGFTTDYARNDLSQFDAGTYTIGSAFDHPFWEPVSGQPDGPIMFVNGRDDRVSTVWEKSFFAPADTTISVSAWLGNVCCTAESGLHYPGPILSWFLNGVFFFDAMTDGAGVMQLFTQSFESGGGLYTLSLRNQSTVYNGNDFAVSGLSVEPVPEPSTLLLFGSTLGLLAARMRRGRRSSQAL